VQECTPYLPAEPSGERLPRGALRAPRALAAAIMQVAVLDRPGHVVIEDRAVPLPRPDEVLVRVRAVGICGSDVHYFAHGRIGRYVVDQPLVLGHEAGGEIVDVGSGVSTARIGQRVAVEPGIPCRRCQYCKGGRYNLCPSVTFLATPPVDGAFAEYLAVPADFAHQVPDELSFSAAALVEPTAVGVHAARLGAVGPGSTTLISGAGPVGLLLAQVLRAFGVSRVHIVDPEPGRRQMAEQLGAHALAPDDLAAGGEFDTVFDASGSPPAMAASVRFARRGGRVVWIGLPPQDEVPMPATVLIDKELELRGVFRYANDYPLAVDLVASGRVETLALVSHTYPLAAAAEALSVAGSRADGVLKVAIEP
jgi:L-iditol 2-dehydrogenase